MNQNQVKTYKYKVGKNFYILIHITQQATANAVSGNALATNQAHVKVFAKKRKKKRVG